MFKEFLQGFCSMSLVFCYLFIAFLMFFLVFVSISVGKNMKIQASVSCTKNRVYGKPKKSCEHVRKLRKIQKKLYGKPTNHCGKLKQNKGRLKNLD